MDLSNAVLGKTVATALQDRISIPILVIGSDKFTRSDLSHVECFNFLAAANINRALKDLDVKNTRDLFKNFAPSALALPRVGAVALAVIGAAFQAKNIGGDHPLEAWVSRHSAEGVEGIRTFHTMKHQMQQETAAENKDRKQRKQQRRNKAHQIRSTRFLDKAAEASGIPLLSPERNE